MTVCGVLQNRFGVLITDVPGSNEDNEKMEGNTRKMAAGMASIVQTRIERSKLPIPMPSRVFVLFSRAERRTGGR
jgi:hypothetical protein